MQFCIPKRCKLVCTTNKTHHLLLLCQFLWSSAWVILLVPSKGKLSGGWLWAEHFGIALTVLLAGCFPPFPSWLFFLFFKSACHGLHTSILGMLMLAFVGLFHRLCFEYRCFMVNTSSKSSWPLVPILVLQADLPFQLLAGLCWKPGQGPDSGLFHSKKCFLQHWMSEIC